MIPKIYRIWPADSISPYLVFNHVMPKSSAHLIITELIKKDNNQRVSFVN